VLSVIEDILTVGLAILAAFHPVVILGVIAVFLVLMIWLAPKIYRSIRRMLAQLASFFGRAQEIHR
jgi:uncharacterized membrane protein YjgN (DUF898 family)